MIATLPPLASAPAAKLRLELRLTPSIDRDDAVQEAWLAHLEGRSPARAVNTFAQRERRHRRRQRAVEGFDHRMRPLERSHDR